MVEVTCMVLNDEETHSYLEGCSIVRIIVKEGELPDPIDHMIREAVMYGRYLSDEVDIYRITKFS